MMSIGLPSPEIINTRQTWEKRDESPKRKNTLNYDYSSGLK